MFRKPEHTETKVEHKGTKVEHKKPDAPIASKADPIDGVLVHLLDANRVFLAERRVEKSQAHQLRVTVDGLTYEHCDTLGDGTWRYALTQ